MESELIAACGLDCEPCEIRRAPFDPGAAAALVGWFHREGWLAADEGLPEVLERNMYCCGCLGDRAVHWSADCWILACCVDERGLQDCSLCPQFPCPRLVEWSGQNARYTAALARLTARRAASPGDACG